jgi:TolB-like protein/tetratricopeptide (TPR) repeat protein
MSGDPEQEYFADGMVEDLITGLSRIRWLFVIARNSSLVYKGKAVDVRQIGRELGVRYVLEGGVRKAGGRLRITAQLIEAETATHLWADKFDGALQDVFDLQDQITDQVVGIVEPSLRKTEIERSRLKPPENLGAYDLYLRAIPLSMARHADTTIAIGLLENALRLDPNYAAAHAQMAVCRQRIFLWSGFDETERTMALGHARAAIACGGDDPNALAIAAFALNLIGKDRDAALTAIDRALSINPSSARAHFMGSLVHAYGGNFEAAAKYGDRALRLSPFDPMSYAVHLGRGLAAICGSRWDEAAEHFNKAVQVATGPHIFHFFLAAALAQGGQLEEAKSISDQGLERAPGWKVRTFSEMGLTAAIADKLVAGARLLRLPE